MVESCLLDLGREVCTTGVMKHVPNNLQFEYIPLNWFYGKIAKGMRDKAILYKANEVKVE